MAEEREPFYNRKHNVVTDGEMTSHAINQVF